MIGTDLLCAGAVAALLLGLAPGRLWVLYVALAAESGGSVLFAPAMQARTPAIVGTGRQLTSANALFAASDGVVRLIGGPLGGILMAVAGIRWLIVIDSLTYLISAAAIAPTTRTPDVVRPQRRLHLPRVGLRLGPSPRGGRRRLRQRAGRSVAADLAGGIRALRDQRTAGALLPRTPGSCCPAWAWASC
jgi:MFS family permease